MPTDWTQTRNGPIRAWTVAAVAALVLTGVLAAGSPARAATAGSVCADYTVRKSPYHWSVVGTGLSCKTAKPWLAKLVGAHYRASASNIVLHGPRGYKCSTATDRKGYAFAGACYVGTLAHPTKGFQWFGG